MKKYSFTKGLLKGVIAFVMFTIPVILQVSPEEYLNLTIGGILVMVMNAAKFYYTQNFR